MPKLSSLKLVLVCCATGIAGACGDKAPEDGKVDANLVGFAQEPGAGSPEVAPPPPPAPPPMRINVGDRILAAPTDFQMAVVFYNVIGLEPPFDQWARADPRTRSVNEFEREEMAGRIQQELLLASQAAAGVGVIEINTSSGFGEYDMAAQGFRLNEIDSDRSYRWGFGGNEYRLTMQNGSDAQLWRIPPEDAKRLIESINYRNVDLKLRIKIVGADPDGRGGGTLQGRIVGYQVFARDGRKVGEMAFQ